MSRILAALAMSAAFAPACMAETSAVLSECAPLAGQGLKLVVPYKAGGGYDSYARSLAPAIETVSGMSVTVVNMASAGGRVAEERVASAEADEALMLMQSNLNLLVSSVIDADGMATLTRLHPLGAVSIEPNVLIARNDYVLPDPGGSVIFLTSKMTDEELRLLLPAAALRVSTSVVSGYAGSSEIAAAIQRGDGDISRAPYTTSQRLIASGELSIEMALTNGPLEDAPDLPYLAGEGSVVWTRTEALPPEERDALRRYAELTAGVSTGYNGLFIAKAANDTIRLCLSAAVDDAIQDAGFQERARVAKLEPRPTSGAAFRDALDQGLAQLEEMKAYLQATFPE